MSKITICLFLASISILGCLTAPEFERTNERDMANGTPYVRYLQYSIGQNGLNVNWYDGSLQNNAFILTQTLYDNSSENPESLVKEVLLDGNTEYYNERNPDLGYPFELTITSVIYEDNSETIKASYSDTVNIEFGSLRLASRFTDGDSLVVSLLNYANGFIDNLIVERDNNGEWEFLIEYEANVRNIKIPIDGFSGNGTFRLSHSFTNFNGNLGKANTLLIPY